MAETKTLDRRTRADDDGSLPRICPFEKLTPKQLDSLAVWFWKDEVFEHEYGMRVTWARLTPERQMSAKAQWEKDQKKEIEWQRETDALNKQYDEHEKTVRSSGTQRFIARTLELVMPPVIKALRNYTDARIRALREEVDAKLEGLPHDAGVHERGKKYKRGALVTDGGSVFIAQRFTEEPIGGDPPSPDWRLFCQRGKSAR